MAALCQRSFIYLVLQPSEKQLAEDLDQITQEMIDDGTLPKLAKSGLGLISFKILMTL
ncbi:hypothetical protein ACEQPO_19980 [Bacillus sp. SL00103]